jgi:hypothetical protein
MIPNIINVRNYFLSQLLSLLSFLSLKEFEYITIGKGTIELYSIAHCATNYINADAKASNLNNRYDIFI